MVKLILYKSTLMIMVYWTPEMQSSYKIPGSLSSKWLLMLMLRMKLFITTCLIILTMPTQAVLFNVE